MYLLGFSGPTSNKAASVKQETISSHQQQLPSNTLLITLNPPGQTFYAPSLVHGRSPSPTPGYSSDPESTVREDGDSNLNLVALPSSRRRRQRGRKGQEADNEENVTRTARWQDLFKWGFSLCVRNHYYHAYLTIRLVTTWTTIKDNENSLEDIIRGLDHLISDDQVLPLVSHYHSDFLRSFNLLQLKFPSFRNVNYPNVNLEWRSYEQIVQVSQPNLKNVSVYFVVVVLCAS